MQKNQFPLILQPNQFPQDTPMKSSTFTLPSVLLLFSIVLAGPSGCAYDPHYSEPVYRSYYYPYYYDYYYYPGVSVYFHYSTGDYYYRTGNRWVRTRTLPSHIHLDPRTRRNIKVKTDRPYKKYPEHRRSYQPQPKIRPDVKRNRQEREYHRKTYRHHKKQQETYKKKWEENNRRRR